MELYRYESSRNCGAWTEELQRATGEYEDEKDYLMADDPDDDETVRLVCINVPDDLMAELIDKHQEIKQAKIMLEPGRKDEDPREDGYDFDYYAVWSDDLEKRGRESKMAHELKILPEFFEAVTSGRKRFEIRKNDRGFKVGDQLVLRECDFWVGEFTGNSHETEITYITDYAQKDGYVVLGI